MPTEQYVNTANNTELFAERVKYSMDGTEIDDALNNAISNTTSIHAGTNISIISGPSGPVISSSIPNGPCGPTGLSGPCGPSGVAGSGGAVGPCGPLGPCGPRGITGARGSAGPTGSSVNGPCGPCGPSGNQGVTGSRGPCGPSGNMGIIGAAPRGAQGNTGLTGARGPQLQGYQGLTGAKGPCGPCGPSGYQGVVGSGGKRGVGTSMAPTTISALVKTFTPTTSGTEIFSIDISSGFKGGFVAVWLETAATSTMYVTVQYLRGTSIAKQVWVTLRVNTYDNHLGWYMVDPSKFSIKVILRSGTASSVNAYVDCLWIYS